MAHCLTATTKAALAGRVTRLLAKGMSFVAKAAGEWNEEAHPRASDGKFSAYMSAQHEANDATLRAARADRAVDAIRSGPRRTAARAVAAEAHREASGAHERAREAAKEAGLAPHVQLFEHEKARHEKAAASHEAAVSAAEARGSRKLPAPPVMSEAEIAAQTAHDEALREHAYAQRFTETVATDNREGQEDAADRHQDAADAFDRARAKWDEAGRADKAREATERAAEHRTAMEAHRQAAVALGAQARLRAEEATQATMTADDARTRAVGRAQMFGTNKAYEESIEAHRASIDAHKAASAANRAAGLEERAAFHDEKVSDLSERLAKQEAKAAQIRATWVSVAETRSAQARAASDAANAKMAEAKKPDADVVVRLAAVRAHREAAEAHRDASSRWGSNVGDPNRAMAHLDDAAIHDHLAREASALAAAAPASNTAYTTVYSPDPKDHFAAARASGEAGRALLNAKVIGESPDALARRMQSAAEHFENQAKHFKTAYAAAKAAKSRADMKLAQSSARSAAASAKRIAEQAADANLSAQALRISANPDTGPLRPLKLGDQVRAVTGSPVVQAEAQRMLSTIQDKHPEIHAALQRYPLPLLAYRDKIPRASGLCYGWPGKGTQKIEVSLEWNANSAGPVAFRPGVSRLVASGQSEEGWRLDTFIHELGHHIESQPGVSELRDQAMTERVRTGRAKWAISKYALKNRREYFAETYIAYHIMRDTLRAHDPIGYALMEKVHQHLGVTGTARAQA